MRPPQQATEALSWIKAALRDGRYTPTPHFLQRLSEREVSLNSARQAVQRASACEPYGRIPDHGGSCWRVHGKDLEDRSLSLGVETYVDEQGRAAVLCTIFDTRTGR